ncbi:MAG: beta-galactosidase [Nitrospirae bacterium]|nr:beta-galactosidase [Nitrospirota bacterium]
MKPYRPLLPLTLAGLALFACSNGEEPAPLPVGDTFGISSHMALGMSPQATDSRSRELQDLRDVGVRWIRRDISWDQIERNPGEFDFEAQDAMVSDATAQGFSLIGLIGGGTPAWATQGPHSDSIRRPRSNAEGATSRGSSQDGATYAPDDPEQFGRFAGQVARHYRGTVNHWEIWNEMNLAERFFRPRADPILYARMLESAYREIKSADPTSVVSFGGLSSSDPLLYPDRPVPWGFLSDALERTPTLASHFDALSIHPYTFLQTLSPEEAAPGYGSLEALLTGARGALHGGGAGDKRLWITEFGWPSYNDQTGPYGYGVTELDQARFLVRAFVLAHAEGFERICWYTYGDDSGTARPEGENYFGLVRHSGEPKPVYLAYRELARQLGASSFVRRLGPDEDIPSFARVYEYDEGGRPRLVVWAETAASGEIALPWNSRAAVEVISLVPTETPPPYSTAGREVRLVPSTTPVVVKEK